MRKSTIFLALFLVLVGSLVIACRQESLVVPASDEPKRALGENLSKNPAAYRRAMQERTAPEGPRFTIEEVRREESTLVVTVKGGCSEDSFHAIWDGLILESYPTQIKLVLVHDKTQEDCPGENQFTVRINLDGITHGEVAPEDCVFHVANGSAVQDKSLQPDGSVVSSNG